MITTNVGEPENVSVMCDGKDMFVIVNGVKIARLEYQWVPLVAGWRVEMPDDYGAIEIIHDMRH